MKDIFIFLQPIVFLFLGFYFGNKQFRKEIAEKTKKLNRKKIKTGVIKLKTPQEAREALTETENDKRVKEEMMKVIQ